MPIYEYQCQACGHEFEATQRITDANLKDCPVCSKPELQKLISASSFRLKGGGWYKDGYGNPQKPRTDNQVFDGLQKAIDKDKKKTADSDSAPSSESPAAVATTDSAATTSSSSDTGSSGSSSDA